MTFPTLRASNRREVSGGTLEGIDDAQRCRERSRGAADAVPVPENTPAFRFSGPWSGTNGFPLPFYSPNQKPAFSGAGEAGAIPHRHVQQRDLAPRFPLNRFPHCTPSGHKRPHGRAGPQAVFDRQAAGRGH